MTGDIREELAKVISENRSIAKIMGDGYVSVMQAGDEEIADALLASPLLDRIRREAAADALEEAAREVPTGMFVVDAHSWLRSRAAELRAGGRDERRDVASGEGEEAGPERGGRSLELDLGERRHHPECDCPGCRPWY